MKLFIVMVSIFCLPLSASIKFSDAEINLMHQKYRIDTANVTKNQVVKRLLEGQFLLAKAKEKQPKLLHTQSDVGFDTNYHKRRYLYTLLQPFVDDKLALQTLTELPISKESLKALLGNYPFNGEIDDITKRNLKSEYLVDNEILNLTYFELYSSLSMQNRYRLHQGDKEILLQEVNKRLNFNQVSNYVKPKLKLQNLSYTTLESIALAEVLRLPMKNYFGVNQMMHSDSLMLNYYEKSVTDEQINKYYAKNIERFNYLSHVKSKGVYFSTQTQAFEFYNAVIKNGWSKTINHFNVEDIFRQYHNRLGRNLNSNDWAIQTAFNFPANKTSPPIRTPDGQWLVLNNGDKDYDVYELNTPTVQYQAKKQLAKSLAIKNYHQGFQQWLQNQSSNG